MRLVALLLPFLFLILPPPQFDDRVQQDKHMHDDALIPAVPAFTVHASQLHGMLELPGKLMRPEKTTNLHTRSYGSGQGSSNQSRIEHE
ncbi:hypothetical protein DER45DRAFT_550214 [Fusarium avenaceum]|nr:hypothetical protein DER45DRAFT_550214 [Fusarium avenaceum]